MDVEKENERIGDLIKKVNSDWKSQPDIEEGQIFDLKPKYGGGIFGRCCGVLVGMKNFRTFFIVDEKGYIFIPSQSAKPTIRTYSDYPAIPFITQL